MFFQPSLFNPECKRMIPLWRLSRGYSQFSFQLAPGKTASARLLLLSDLAPKSYIMLLDLPPSSGEVGFFFQPKGRGLLPSFLELFLVRRAFSLHMEGRGRPLDCGIHDDRP